ncbi:MAG: hypothetical protein AB8G14_03285 [Ilumatobacter sp.]
MEVLGYAQGLTTEPISRRRFITVAGAGTALATVDARGFLAAPLTSDGDDLTLTLVDPDSQLRLVYTFVNLDHDVAGNRLVAASSGAPRIRIGLQPQHTAEYPITAVETPALAQIDHHNAAASRLVFDATPPIDLTVEALLDLASFTLRTTTAAGDPNDNMTMIELPADLRWSPGSGVVVTADSGPTSTAGVTQLHRLLLDAGGPIEVTPVHNASTSDPFSRRVPSALSRDLIVSTAASEGPAVAQHVRLTNQGAWASINGEWSGVSWIQRVQGGRDQFAQVTERGVLMPFGHEAVWTQTNTRIWIADQAGDLVSILINEEHFALSGDSEKAFPGQYSPFAGRNMPFRQIIIEESDNQLVRKGEITWVDDDDNAQSLGLNDAWYVELEAPGSIWDGYLKKVSYTGVDSIDNDPYPFSLRAVFVSEAGLAKSGVRNKLAEFYASDDGEDARLMFSSLRNVAWAEPVEAGDSVTTLSTTRMQVGLVPITGVSAANLEAAGQLPLQPVIVAGEVASNGVGGIEVEFTPEYLTSGNDATINPKQAFLDLVVPRDFPVGGEARAVMTPDLRAEQFNQTLGVGPKFEDSGAGVPDTWNPAQAFGDVAQILRGVKLAELVEPILIDLAIDGIDIPGLEIERFDDRVEQTYSWCPPNIKSVEPAGFIADSDTTLCVSISSVIALEDDVDTSATVEFRVSDFTLVIPPGLDLVQLDIRELRAVQTTTGTPDLTFDVASWRLGDDLAWMEPLLDLLTPAGADFDIDISSSAIDFDLSVALPDITLGVLKITNFAIGLYGSFPFTGDDEPRIGIGVGSRANPVSLQILQFGGGFSVEMEFSTQGLELLIVKAFVSARLVEIDIVVAQAYCEVAVSAVFKLKEGAVTFIGEVSLTAHFNVLGVIGATLSIKGKVKYEVAEKKVTVTGTIHWSVTAVFTYSGKVRIGSIDFELGDDGASGLRRGRAARAADNGGGGLGDDPSGSFGSAHSFSSWNDYVDAFSGEV